MMHILFEKEVLHSPVVQTNNRLTSLLILAMRVEAVSECPKRNKFEQGYGRFKHVASFR